MSNSERNLLTIFIALLATGALLIGGKSYLSKKRASDQSLQSLQAEIDELEAFTEEKAVWEQREDWIATHLPPSASDQQMRLAMSELSKSKGAGVEILDREYPPVEALSHFDVAKIKFRVKGALPDVLVWLQKLIAREKLLSVSYLRINQKGDSETAEFAVELHKYYAKQ